VQPKASGAECSDDLEDLHREMGEKARELRHAQESVRLLQRELQEQRLLAEQYRSQVEVLEEQLSGALMKRRRQAGEELADQIAAASGGRARPLSARGSRPPSATSPRGFGGLPGVTPASPSSPQVPRAWTEAKGSQTPRAGRSPSHTPARRDSVPPATPRSTHSMELARSKLGFGPPRDLTDSSDED